MENHTGETLIRSMYSNDGAIFRTYGDLVAAEGNAHYNYNYICALCVFPWGVPVGGK
jgi:hypothetical protein